MHVKTSSGEYDVLIESGIRKNTAEIIKTLPRLKNVETFAIISDETVAQLYSDDIAISLAEAGYKVILIKFPPGEKSKNAEQFFLIQNILAEKQITRSDALIALGGGVVGDLTGFVAATYLRGLPFIQIPTTLLAMVDSSVGGKTGIDIPAGKNLVGAFIQPAAVICDPETLKTLKPEIFNDGMAEVIKHGMIRSEELLQMITNENINEIIEANVKIKRDIVQKDEFDTGERQLLNFGHTIGHAIEKLSEFEVSHGSAVAIGMNIITRAAVKKGVCPQECLTVLESLTEKYNLPRETIFKPQEIFNAALSDKKRMGDTITEVVPVKLGFCELKKIPINELKEWI